jgi:hypothetical protein
MNYYLQVSMTHSFRTTVVVVVVVRAIQYHSINYRLSALKERWSKKFKYFNININNLNKLSFLVVVVNNAWLQITTKKNCISFAL